MPEEKKLYLEHLIDTGITMIQSASAQITECMDRDNFKKDVVKENLAKLESSEVVLHYIRILLAKEDGECLSDEDTKVLEKALEDNV